MALERPSEDLRPLNPQTDTIILYGRNRRLGNAGTLSELVLAQLLELAQNAH